ncbi:MAG: hypothetical protein QF570_06215 [Myxococcota bacterium]|jgi:peroxiredoxin family protein|nr:hypothetical protein [Myxococcota bacterium]
MDLLFILRDAEGSSAISTLSAARDAQANGQDVAVLVTQGALAALASGSFEWPRALSGPPMRMALANAAKSLDLPVAGRGAAKALDPKALVGQVADAGVRLVACPTWSSLLGLGDSLPQGLEAADSDKVSDLLAKAGKVVGTL